MFHQYVGMTFTDYRNNLRFDTAYSLLQTTALSIEDIISFIGLSSKTYFYKEFRRRYRISPSQARHADVYSPVKRQFSGETDE